LPKLAFAIGPAGEVADEVIDGGLSFDITVTV